MEQNKPSAESQARMNQFRSEYLDLVKKHDVDFVAYPQYVQTQQGVFTTVCGMTLVDKKTLPVPSPMGGKVIKD